jgi:callose synthase
MHYVIPSVARCSVNFSSTSYVMPEEQQVNESFLPSRFRNFWQRLQLRYGFSTSFRKIESNQVEARQFALVWNEIISKFREEDIVSDREVGCSIYFFTI